MEEGMMKCCIDQYNLDCQICADVVKLFQMEDMEEKGERSTDATPQVVESGKISVRTIRSDSDDN